MFLEEFPVAWKELNLFERNRIFMDRTINVGSISAEQAILMVLQDLTCVQQELITMRIAQPYSSYDDFDFIIPVGTSGDTYDRFAFVTLKFGKA
jgi:NADH-quinone oxidoreductase subunit D